MEPILKLREVLWEVTPRCDKNCMYCGSKELKSKEPRSYEDLVRLAAMISGEGVESVTLTGGEPGTLGPVVLNAIVRALKGDDGKIEVKCVTNGCVISALEVEDLMKFDAIGLSVNTLDDIENFRGMDKLNDPRIRDRITIITNFGTHNVWDFGAICAFMVERFNCWQVQLTMGGDFQLNADGIKHLRERLDQCFLPPSVRIVEADNLQKCHRCTAGVMGCSITYNGEVVACLSERSWAIGLKSYGNVFDTPLEEIWQSGFGDIRFCGREKCCRDCIDYPEEIETAVDSYPETDEDWTEIRAPDDTLQPPPLIDRVYVYGVVTPRPTIPDKFDRDFNPPSVVVYGVTTSNTWTGSPSEPLDLPPDNRRSIDGLGKYLDEKNEDDE